MNPPRIISFIVLIVAVVAGIIYLNSQKAPRSIIDEKMQHLEKIIRMALPLLWEIDYTNLLIYRLQEDTH